jgi:hypothetical protein
MFGLLNLSLPSMNKHINLQMMHLWQCHLNLLDCTYLLRGISIGSIKHFQDYYIAFKGLLLHIFLLSTIEFLSVHITL